MCVWVGGHDNQTLDSGLFPLIIILCFFFPVVHLQPYNSELESL